MWFQNRSNTNQAVQAQKMARYWKFWIKKVEELYYPCSENKGADQLRGYREADLRLCFRLCRLLVFSWGGSYLLPACKVDKCYLLCLGASMEFREGLLGDIKTANVFHHPVKAKI